MKGLLSTLILMLFALTSHCQQRIVKKRTEISGRSYKNTDGKEESSETVREFIVYNKQGREIEHGEFGEQSATHVVTDSSVAFYCGQDYTKIKSVDFKTYNEQGRETRRENWTYKDNVKNKLQTYVISKYDRKGHKSKETYFSSAGIVEKITTYTWKKDTNNISVIDSIFSSDYGPKKLRIRELTNQFDSQNRITKTTELLDQKLVSRKIFLYQDVIGNTTTELTYYSSSDISLRSINETEFGFAHFDCTGKKLRGYYKPVNTILEKEDQRFIYTYNRDCLLEKIEYYYGLKLKGYSKFEYEFY